MNKLIAFLTILTKSEAVEETLKPISMDHLPLFDWNNISINDFYFEIVAATLIIFYVTAFMHGTKENKAKARKFLDAHIDIWKQNFYSIGDGSKLLVQDGPKDFVLFGSGRLHCKSATATLQLVGKQDILASAYRLYSGVQPQDKITVHVSLDDDQSDNIVFSVLRKSKQAAILKERWDLDNFAKVKEYPGFPSEDYVLLTDSVEFANAVWALDSFKDILWQSLGLSTDGEGERFPVPVLEQISLTDAPSKAPETMEELKCGKSLQFVFNISELEGKMLELQPLISQFVFDFIDTLGTKGRLSAEGKAKSKKLRAAAEMVILKNEEKKKMAELADKKIADRKAREAALLKLSPEAQRKAEEKLRKKDAKKTLSKQMKIKRH